MSNGAPPGPTADVSGAPDARVSGVCVGNVSMEREPCSRSSASTRCLDVDKERTQGIVGSDLLPCHPAPILECFLTNAPAARKVGKTAHVEVVMREGEGVFVVVEVELRNLKTHQSGSTFRRARVSL